MESKLNMNSQETCVLLEQTLRHRIPRSKLMTFKLNNFERRILRRLRREGYKVFLSKNKYRFLSPFTNEHTPSCYLIPGRGVRCYSSGAFIDTRGPSKELFCFMLRLEHRSKVSSRPQSLSKQRRAEARNKIFHQSEEIPF